MWSGGERVQFTLDGYLIRIDGRIFKTRSLPYTDPDTGIGSNVQFFTNALDLEVVGLDAVVTTQFAWGDGASTDLSVAFNHNQVEVVSQSRVNGLMPVSAADVEDIEESYPNNRFTVTADTVLGPRWDLLLRLNYYGEHYDERGRIGGVDGGAPDQAARPDGVHRRRAWLRHEREPALHVRPGECLRHLHRRDRRAIRQPLECRIALRPPHGGQLRGRLLVPALDVRLVDHVGPAALPG